MSGSKSRITRAFEVSIGVTTLAVAYIPSLTRLAESGPSHCLLFRTTGLQCPVCGMTRATIALLHGRVLDALTLNALAFAYVGYLIWLCWCWLRWQAAPRDRSRTRFMVPAMAFAAIVFSVARNLA